jgi:hypothetical protein
MAPSRVTKLGQSFPMQKYGTFPLIVAHWCHVEINIFVGFDVSITQILQNYPQNKSFA